MAQVTRATRSRFKCLSRPGLKAIAVLLNIDLGYWELFSEHLAGLFPSKSELPSIAQS
jgi:hypothetical protein